MNLNLSQNIFRSLCMDVETQSYGKFLIFGGIWAIYNISLNRKCFITAAKTNG